jgi:N-formylglutamate amidohydrolase
VVPADARTSILLTDDALSAELLRMTDSFTDELFRLNPRVARSVVFPVSRLVVDPERFLDDSAEPMSGRGMGVVYTRTADGAALRGAVDEKTRRALVTAHYLPHHHRLTEAVEAAARRWGSCLVVDCHSFPSSPLPYELDQSPGRPEICLGTDAFHTPAPLAAVAVGLFRDAGFRVQLDRPFSGALVPATHYQRDTRVMAIMVEVNRSLYMNEGSGERLATFGEIASRLRSAVTRLIEAARAIGISRARQRLDGTAGRGP